MSRWSTFSSKDHLSSGLDSLPESKVDEDEDGQSADGQTWLDGSQAGQDDIINQMTITMFPNDDPLLLH